MCVGVYRVCAGSPIASIACHNIRPVVVCGGAAWWKRMTTLVRERAGEKPSDTDGGAELGVKTI